MRAIRTLAATVALSLLAGTAEAHTVTENGKVVWRATVNEQFPTSACDYAASEAWWKLPDDHDGSVTYSVCNCTRYAKSPARDNFAIPCVKSLDGPWRCRVTDARDGSVVQQRTPTVIICRVTATGDHTEDEDR